MPCDFCVPHMDGVPFQYPSGHYCALCDLLMLAELPATQLTLTLQARLGISVRVWLEVYLQSSHSPSLGVILGARPARRAHVGRFNVIPWVGPPSIVQIVAAYAPYKNPQRTPDASPGVNAGVGAF